MNDLSPKEQALIHLIRQAGPEAEVRVVKRPTRENDKGEIVAVRVEERYDLIHPHLRTFA